LARVFYGSVLIGMVLSLVAAAVFPLPQHHRYRSNIGVIPDGGREEIFRIEWPRDRIQPLRAASSTSLVGHGGAAVLREGDGAAVSAEVFRLQDSAGNVVGIASRSTSRRSDSDGTLVQGTDWMLILPSRGTLFMTQVNSRDVGPWPSGAGATGVNLAPATDASGFWSGDKRLQITAGPEPEGAGRVLGGSEEFAGLKGTYEETWELGEVTADGTTRGRIILVTRIAAAP
jgi:hypothetical protein